jgi:hypothetical protein
MILIIRYGSGFKIGFREEGTQPYSVVARDCDELKNALDHHYLDGGHVAGSTPESCPLCRMVARNERRSIADDPSH